MDNSDDIYADKPTRGVLLINLGSPLELSTQAVREYLREFLADERVIDIHPLLRYLLLYGIILPTRPQKTVKAYEQIWTEKGSPLIVNSVQLQRKLVDHLGESFTVALAMRYGLPNIQQGLELLMEHGCQEIIVLPLYPQYATSSTGTALAEVFKQCSQMWNSPGLKVIPPFYNHPGYIKALVASVNRQVADLSDQHLLFSFHGVPLRHILKSETIIPGDCQAGNPCPEIGQRNAYCYRAQCYQTANAVASGLKLKEHSVAFQSRLGRTPWIKPYTDHYLPQLRTQGVKRLVVMSPSFVADCLETLEEIKIRLKQQWLGLGGEQFLYIPCLNDDDLWVSALGSMIQSAAGEPYGM